jgi:hypothetical protein
MQWQKTYGGSYFDEPISIIQLHDNSFVVAGVTYSSNGDITGVHQRADAWVIKIDSAGNLIWQKLIGGKALDFAYSVKETDDNRLNGCRSFLIHTMDHLLITTVKEMFWIFELDEMGRFYGKNYSAENYDEDCTDIEKNRRWRIHSLWNERI